MRKSIAAATVAASLTIGGAAGAVLFTPALSGAQTDETDPTDEPSPVDPAGEVDPASDPAERTRITQRLRKDLTALVDAGTITAAQADAVAQHLAEQAPLRHGRGGHGTAFGEDVAEVLGLTTEELRDRLGEGQTLAAIAGAEGVDVQAVVDAIVAAHQERLDQAVADGDLTQEEADERAAALEEHARDIVDGAFERRMGREGGMRGPGHGPSTGAGTTGS